MVNGNTHTLAFHAGYLDTTGDLHDPSNELAAKKACCDQPYKVLEKSYKPSALKATPGLLSATKDIWVVQCGQGQSID